MSHPLEEDDQDEQDVDQPSVPGLVASASHSAPTRAALLQQDRTVNYATLNRRANQVARILRSRGAAPEVRIGISLGRSIDFAIAALGILKSGAAYVPLDPSYPEARRRLIAGDAELLLILGDSSGADLFGRPALSLHAPEIEAADDSDLPAQDFDPGQLAYVIYTSGSTGVPKGVEVTHANLLHLVRWHNAAFQVNADDRATLLANVGFDAAVWELWPYLSAGASLLIPPPETIRQPESLRDFILNSRISILFAPTLLAEALMQIKWPQGAGPRALLTGGDTLRIVPPPGLPFTVVNNYGPAECTVVSTSAEIPPANAGEGLPSIGHAIDGVHIALLDEELREVPTGSPGEICIGGAGVARGYLNQPELSAQRFVLREGARLYRSGDLGSRNPDGSIQFLGRLDEQLSLRGYRIESGEVEAALNSLAAVRTSAVIVREQRDGHRGLTAYLVARDGAALSHDELRQALRLRLPEYMLPEQFVTLAHMPLSDNGKIDRRLLPEPTEETIVAATNLPASPLERELMEVLTGLLGIDRMDRDDDFFLLGGHSFIAAQLIARIRDRFGVELGLRAVFEHPTLAGMAEQIEQRIPVQQ